jgi:hypothetical protein
MAPGLFSKNFLIFFTHEIYHSYAPIFRETFRLFPEISSERLKKAHKCGTFFEKFLQNPKATVGVIGHFFLGKKSTLASQRNLI